MEKQKRNSFSGSVGFVLAAAGSAGEYLEVSLLGGEGRRRFIPGNLPDSGVDVWLYASGNRDCDRPQDKAEPFDGVQ